MKGSGGHLRSSERISATTRHDRSFVAFRSINIKMFMVTAQQSREDAREIGQALGLSEKTVETIHSYPNSAIIHL